LKKINWCTILCKEKEKIIPLTLQNLKGGELKIVGTRNFEQGLLRKISRKYRIFISNQRDS